MKILSLEIGGYHPDESQAKWPVGSIFANEGLYLYQLVRKHKPKKIIEVGTRWGCSTQWLAQACKDNKMGHVYTYDIENIHRDWPKELEKYITFTHRNYFEDTPQMCDLLFEDGAHTTGFTTAVLKQTTAKVIAIHDYMHWDCIKTVKEESEAILGKPLEVFFQPPTDCGVGVWILSQ